MSNAALDVDGVLLNCDLAFAQVASQLLGRPVRPLNNVYDLGERYGITQDQMHETFEYMKTHPQGWAGMPALEGAIEAAKHLQAQGINIHLVTAISEDIRQMRLICLEAHGFVPYDIHCAGHHLASKKAIIERIKPFVFVDDRLTHLNAVPSVPERIWIDHGDSQDGLLPDPSIIRVTSLPQWVYGRFPVQPTGM